MANNPYAGYYTPPEYNVRGDSANGTTGTQTPGAVMNQNTQTPTPKSNNPYAQILNYLPQTKGNPASGYNGLPRPDAPASPTLPPGVPNLKIGTPQGEIPPAQPGYGTGGQITPPPGLPGNGQITPPTAGTPPPDPSGGAPKPPGTEDPAIAAKWYATFPGFENVTTNDVTAYRSNPMGMTFSDWWGKFGSGSGGPSAAPQTPPTAATPPSGGPSAPPPAAPFTPTPTGFDERGQPTGWTTPPPTAAPGSPTAPPGGVPGPSGAAGTPPPNAPPGAPGAQSGPSNDPQALVKAMQALMAPQFQTEQTDLARNMNANAALTGDINSGGYGEQFGRNMGRLIGTQGQTVANMTQAQSLLGQQLASQMDIAKMQDATAKAGIDVQKYGIDVSKLTSIEVAKINSAASHMMAQASLEGSKANAAAGLQGVLASIAQKQQESTQNYNLGLAGLGLDQYKFENPSANTLLAAYLGMSPEQMAAAFSGNNLNFPQFGYTPPPAYKP